MTLCPYIPIREYWVDFRWCMFNATWERSEWYSLFMGVSSLATSGHLPPAPLKQTNTKLETPEPDNTNYTLQLLCSLPGAWEAAPCCRLWSRIQTCAWVAASVLSKSRSIVVLSALYTITLFPLPVSSGYRQFSHCCVGIIFQTAAYGESLFLFRDVNHDSVTRARVCLWLCDFSSCVYSYVLSPYLSNSMPSGLLGRRERGEMPLLRSVLMS